MLIDFTPKQKKEIRNLRSDFFTFFIVIYGSCLIINILFLLIFFSSKMIFLILSLMVYLILCMILSLALFKFYDSYYPHVINTFLIVGLNIPVALFFSGFIIMNTYLWHFDVLPNVISASIIVIFIPLGYFYEKKLINMNYNYLVKSKQLDEVNGRMDISTWQYKKYDKASIFLVKNFFVIIIFSALYISIAIKQHVYRRVFFKFLMSGFLSCIVGAFSFILSGMYLYRIFFVIEWEKKNFKKLYTPFHDLLIIQEEINKNRKHQGLKPYNIRKLYLGKSFYKVIR